MSLRRHDESDEEDQQQLQLQQAAAVHVSQLPIELVVNVFSHLQSTQDLLTVQQVCRQWRDLRSAPQVLVSFAALGPSQS